MEYDAKKLNIINSVIVHLYERSDHEDVRELFLSELRLIVPYSKASFWLHREGADSIISEPVSIDMSKSFLDRYKYFAEKDYVAWFYNYSNSVVYCDSKILKDSVRRSTDFYLGYLLPEKIAFGCGIIIVKDSVLTGTVNLFRTEEYGDFAEEELEYLDFFTPHLENIIYKHHIKRRFDESYQMMLSNAMNHFSVEYCLTQREKEIIDCYCKGLSAEQVAVSLGISLSTVKKHLNHIFTKTGISHKNQLFALVLDSLKASLYS